MRIAGWAADQSGCAHYRLELPLGALDAHGHETWVGMRLRDAPWWDGPATLMGERRAIDVLVGQRVCKPSPSVAWQRLARQRRTDRPLLVFELDDDLFDMPTANGAAHFYADPVIQTNLLHNIEVSDLVTVSTTTLAEKVRAMFPGTRVVVLTNTIGRTTWEAGSARLAAMFPDAAWPMSECVIGWAGSATHRIDLEVVRKPLLQYLRRRGHTLHFVGADYRPLFKGCATRWTPWQADLASYYQTLANTFTVALAPLQPHPFNASKSWLRPLELAALGIPVIASDYGEYTQLVTSGKTGLLVKYEHEWAQHLNHLLDDVNSDHRRMVLALAAHDIAQDHLIENRWMRWEQAYIDAGAHTGT